VGFGATFFKAPVTSQRQLVEVLLSRQGFWGVQMGELPRLLRPGEGREQERKAKKAKKRRRWIGAGGPRR
jgi:hypothetical protein